MFSTGNLDQQCSTNCSSGDYFEMQAKQPTWLFNLFKSLTIKYLATFLHISNLEIDGSLGPKSEESDSDTSLRPFKNSLHIGDRYHSFPFKDILTKLTMFLLDSLADELIPAKMWLESMEKLLRTTLMPHVGSQSLNVPTFSIGLILTSH
jgi:hypothetical protein